MSAYQAAYKVAQLLSRAGFEVYFIGGCVRDMLLGREPKDFDLATNASPRQIGSLRGLESAIYKDTAQAYGVTRIKFGGHITELATFRKDIGAHRGRKHTEVEFASLEEDLARRDFTINALALDFQTNQIIDFVGGLDDLEAGALLFIGPARQRIKEDPLRILRAIRLRNDLDFAYAPETVKAIKAAVDLGRHKAIAVDRLRQELTLMIIHPSRRQALEDLDYFGLLEEFLPEVAAGKLYQQPKQFHAEGDVWAHQLLVMEALPKRPSRQLAWAALLHDIGKTETQTLPVSADDRIRFNRHYEVGAEMARKILQRLRFSKSDIENICWMIYHHISIDDLPKMKPSRQHKVLSHQAFGDLFELHRADAAASWHGRLKAKPRFGQIVSLWRAYQSRPLQKRTPSLKKDLGIDGHWLAQHFPDLTAGPRFGQILTRLQEAYLDSGRRDQDYYLRLAKKLKKEIHN